MTHFACPACSTEAPPIRAIHRTGIGDDQGHATFQPARQYATCPNPDCGAKLVRNPELGEQGLDQWRLEHA